MKKRSKTCRWRWIEKWSGSYRTTCRRFFSFDGYEVDTHAYKFCPGCGRKIEVKE